MKMKEKRVKGFDHTKNIPYNLCKPEYWARAGGNEKMLLVIICMDGGINHLTPKVLLRLDKALGLDEGKMERLLQRMVLTKSSYPLRRLIDPDGNLK